jgi:Ca-activated chloride channel homolog
MRSVFALTSALASLGWIQQTSSAPVEPSSALRIIAPEPSDTLVGTTTIKVEIGDDVQVEAVEFFVGAEPRPICRDQQRPFQCEFDAGRTLKPHRIRVVARLSDGRTDAKTVETTGHIIDAAVDVSGINVPIVVWDYLERPVKGLKKESVRVWEDGVEQEVTSLKEEDVPIEIILAIDVSGSVAPSLVRLKQSLKRFLSLLKPTDQITIVGFNDRVFTVSEPGDSIENRLAGIDRLSARGGTSLHDAVAYAIQRLSVHQACKALIVLTDGDDRTSFASAEAIERKIRETEIVFYPFLEAKAPVPAKIRADMERVAAATAGKAFFLKRADDLETHFTTLLEDLRWHYLLTYTATNTKKDGTFRKITVKASDNSHTLKYRDGYYAVPRPSESRRR